MAPENNLDDLKCAWVMRMTRKNRSRGRPSRKKLLREFENIFQPRVWLRNIDFEGLSLLVRAGRGSDSHQTDNTRTEDLGEADVEPCGKPSAPVVRPISRGVSWTDAHEEDQKGRGYHHTVASKSQDPRCPKKKLGECPTGGGGGSAEPCKLKPKPKLKPRTERNVFDSFLRASPGTLSPSQGQGQGQGHGAAEGRPKPQAGLTQWPGFLVGGGDKLSAESRNRRVAGARCPSSNVNGQPATRPPRSVLTNAPPVEFDCQRYDLRDAVEDVCSAKRLALSDTLKLDPVLDDTPGPQTLASRYNTISGIIKTYGGTHKGLSLVTSQRQSKGVARVAPSATKMVTTTPERRSAAKRVAVKPPETITAPKPNSGGSYKAIRKYLKSLPSRHLEQKFLSRYASGPRKGPPSVTGRSRSAASGSRFPPSEQQEDAEEGEEEKEEGVSVRKRMPNLVSVISPAPPTKLSKVTTRQDDRVAVTALKSPRIAEISQTRSSLNSGISSRVVDVSRKPSDSSDVLLSDGDQLVPEYVDSFDDHEAASFSPSSPSSADPEEDGVTMLPPLSTSPKAASYSLEDVVAGEGTVQLDSCNGVDVSCLPTSPNPELDRDVTGPDTGEERPISNIQSTALLPSPPPPHSGIMSENRMEAKDTNIVASLSSDVRSMSSAPQMAADVLISGPKAQDQNTCTGLPSGVASPGVSVIPQTADLQLLNTVQSPKQHVIAVADKINVSGQDAEDIHTDVKDESSGSSLDTKDDSSVSATPVDYLLCSNSTVKKSSMGIDISVSEKQLDLSVEPEQPDLKVTSPLAVVSKQIRSELKREVRSDASVDVIAPFSSCSATTATEAGHQALVSSNPPGVLPTHKIVDPAGLHHVGDAASTTSDVPRSRAPTLSAPLSPPAPETVSVSPQGGGEAPTSDGCGTDGVSAKGTLPRDNVDDDGMSTSVTVSETVAVAPVSSLAPQTENAIASSVTQSENPISSPSPQAENPISSPAIVAENPISSPAIEAENPISPPAIEAANPISSPATQGENLISSPATQAENLISSPAIEAENPISPPSIEAANPISSPATQGENPISSHATQAENPISPPATQGENSISSPATQGENPISPPATQTVDPISSPATQAENPISSPATQGENSISSPATQAENPISAPAIEAENLISPPGTQIVDPISPLATPTVAPISPPATQTEDPISSPATQAENPISGPAIEAENPISPPATQTVDPISSPATQAENPILSPATQNENPISSPAIEAVDPISSPAPRAENLASSPASEAENPTALPVPQREKTISLPATQAENSTSPQAEISVSQNLVPSLAPRIENHVPSPTVRSASPVSLPNSSEIEICKPDPSTETPVTSSEAETILPPQTTNEPETNGDCLRDPQTDTAREIQSNQSPPSSGVPTEAAQRCRSESIASASDDVISLDIPRANNTAEALDLSTTDDEPLPILVIPEGPREDDSKAVEDTGAGDSPETGPGMESEAATPAVGDNSLLHCDNPVTTEDQVVAPQFVSDTEEPPAVNSPLLDEAGTGLECAATSIPIESAAESHITPPSLKDTCPGVEDATDVPKPSEQPAADPCSTPAPHPAAISNQSDNGGTLPNVSKGEAEIKATNDAIAIESGQSSSRQDSNANISGLFTENPVENSCLEAKDGPSIYAPVLSPEHDKGRGESINGVISKDELYVNTKRGDSNIGDDDADSMQHDVTGKAVACGAEHSVKSTLNDAEAGERSEEMPERSPEENSTTKGVGRDTRPNGGVSQPSAADPAQPEVGHLSGSSSAIGETAVDDDDDVTDTYAETLPYSANAELSSSHGEENECTSDATGEAITEAATTVSKPKPDTEDSEFYQIHGNPPVEAGTPGQLHEAMNKAPHDDCGVSKRPVCEEIPECRSPLRLHPSLDNAYPTLLGSNVLDASSPTVDEAPPMDVTSHSMSVTDRTAMPPLMVHPEIKSETAGIKSPPNNIDANSGRSVNDNDDINHCDLESLTPSEVDEDSENGLTVLMSPVDSQRNIKDVAHNTTGNSEEPDSGKAPDTMNSTLTESDHDIVARKQSMHWSSEVLKEGDDLDDRLAIRTTPESVGPLVLSASAAAMENAKSTEESDMEHIKSTIGNSEARVSTVEQGETIGGLSETELSTLVKEISKDDRGLSEAKLYAPIEEENNDISVLSETDPLAPGKDDRRDVGEMFEAQPRSSVKEDSNDVSALSEPRPLPSVTSENKDVSEVFETEPCTSVKEDSNYVSGLSESKPCVSVQKWSKDVSEMSETTPIASLEEGTKYASVLSETDPLASVQEDRKDVSEMSETKPRPSVKEETTDVSGRSEPDPCVLVLEDSCQVSEMSKTEHRIPIKDETNDVSGPLGAELCTPVTEDKKDAGGLSEAPPTSVKEEKKDDSGLSLGELCTPVTEDKKDAGGLSETEPLTSVKKDDGGLSLGELCTPVTEDKKDAGGLSETEPLTSVKKDDSGLSLGELCTPVTEDRRYACGLSEAPPTSVKEDNKDGSGLSVSEDKKYVSGLSVNGASSLSQPGEIVGELGQPEDTDNYAVNSKSPTECERTSQISAEDVCTTTQGPAIAHHTSEVTPATTREDLQDIEWDEKQFSTPSGSPGELTVVEEDTEDDPLDHHDHRNIEVENIASSEHIFPSFKDDNSMTGDNGDHVTSRDRDDDGVTSRDRDDDGVTFRDRDDEGVTARDKDDDGVTSRDRDDDGVTSRDTDDDGMTSRDTDDDGVTSRDRDDDGVTSRDRDDGVTSRDRDDDGVTSRDRDDDGVTSRDKDDDGVTSRDRDGDGVTSRDRDDDGVTSRDRDDDGVTSRDRDDDGVTSRDADDGITSKVVKKTWDLRQLPARRQTAAEERRRKREQGREKGDSNESRALNKKSKAKKETPIKSPTGDSVGLGVNSRLAQEFSMHNWLEHKIHAQLESEASPKCDPEEKPSKKTEESAEDVVVGEAKRGKRNVVQKMDDMKRVKANLVEKMDDIKRVKENIVEKMDGIKRVKGDVVEKMADTRQDKRNVVEMKDDTKRASKRTDKDHVAGQWNVPMKRTKCSHSDGRPRSHGITTSGNTAVSLQQNRAFSRKRSLDSAMMYDKGHETSVLEYTGPKSLNNTPATERHTGHPVTHPLEEKCDSISRASSCGGDHAAHNLLTMTGSRHGEGPVMAAERPDRYRNDTKDDGICGLRITDIRSLAADPNGGSTVKSPDVHRWRPTGDVGQDRSRSTTAAWPHRYILNDGGPMSGGNYVHDRTFDPIGAIVRSASDKRQGAMPACDADVAYCPVPNGLTPPENSRPKRRRGEISAPRRMPSGMVLPPASGKDVKDKAIPADVTKPVVSNLDQPQPDEDVPLDLSTSSHKNNIPVDPEGCVLDLSKKQEPAAISQNPQSNGHVMQHIGNRKNLPSSSLPRVNDAAVAQSHTNGCRPDSEHRRRHRGLASARASRKSETITCGALARPKGPTLKDLQEAWSLLKSGPGARGIGPDRPATREQIRDVLAAVRDPRMMPVRESRLADASSGSMRGYHRTAASGVAAAIQDPGMLAGQAPAGLLHMSRPQRPVPRHPHHGAAVRAPPNGITQGMPAPRTTLSGTTAAAPATLAVKTSSLPRRFTHAEAMYTGSQTSSLPSSSSSSTSSSLSSSPMLRRDCMQAAAPQGMFQCDLSAAMLNYGRPPFCDVTIGPPNRTLPGVKGVISQRNTVTAWNATQNATTVQETIHKFQYAQDPCLEDQSVHNVAPRQTPGRDIPVAISHRQRPPTTASPQDHQWLHPQAGGQHRLTCTGPSQPSAVTPATFSNLAAPTQRLLNVANGALRAQAKDLVNTTSTSTALDPLLRYSPGGLLLQGVVCAYCKGRASFLCSGCRGEAYCNAQCQHMAWTYHKLKCSQSGTMQSQ